MKTVIQNLYRAPKSTLLAILLLVGFTICKAQGIIETETYATLSAIVIPIMFTDIMKEKKSDVTE
ncbi:hypothetical protein [Solirubrum puertoriconensis]|uniref:Uncharacterized protein n=1 Tax=Solirubrum puertoriconensis TaxID=1751427 RepID=A0A9X0HK35_SOLP1|nr:hypothetical protein [Solirubrum puertoriconensis]KUG07414.1 hypothetical protein ASU33_13760 [Solirubrum puertoriconensis]